MNRYRYDVQLTRYDKPRTTVHHQVEAGSLALALRAAASVVVDIRSASMDDPIFSRAIVELIDE